MGYEPPPPPSPAEHHFSYEAFWANPRHGAEQRLAQEQNTQGQDTQEQDAQGQDAQERDTQERDVRDTKQNLADFIWVFSKLPRYEAPSLYTRVFPTAITVVADDATTWEARRWAAEKELETECARYGFQARVEVISTEEFFHRIRDLEWVYQDETGKQLNREHPDERWNPAALGRFLSDHPWAVVITKPAEWLLSGAIGDIGVMLMGALLGMRRRAKRRETAAREAIRVDTVQLPTIAAAIRVEALQHPAIAAAIRRLEESGGLEKVAADPASGSHPLFTPAQPQAPTRAEQLGDVLVIDTRTAVVLRLNPAMPVPQHAYDIISRLDPAEVGGLRALAFDWDTGRWLPPT
jgi:hypothetical protein